MRYHITQSGLPAECHATVRACPLGGDHYEDKVEALQAAVHLALKPVVVQEKDVFDRMSEASNTRKSDVIDRLSKDRDYRVRQAIANNPNTDWVTLSNMVAGETNKEVLFSLAGAENLSYRDLNVLSFSEDADVRAAIAGRSDLSDANQATAYRDRASKVRVAYARNRNVDSSHLFVLALDESPDVRLAVARNPATPVYLLKKLMGTEEPSTKIRLNARTTLHSLGKRR